MVDPYYEETELYNDYYNEPEIYAADVEIEETFSEDGFFEHESFQTLAAEPELLGWEDDIEPDFRETPMRSHSSSQKSPKASKNEKVVDNKEKDDGIGDMIDEILVNRTNVLDALFDFGEESEEEEEGDEEEITVELEPVEDEEKIELEWED